MSVAVVIFSAYDGSRSLLDKRLVCVLAIALVMLVIANRASLFSAHFAEVQKDSDVVWSPLQSLSFITGQPSLLSYAWYYLAAALWGLCLIFYLRVWQQMERGRAYVSAAFLLLNAAAIAVGAAIDGGYWRGLYLQGFVLCFFVLFVSVNMALEAARRSQQLSMREWQMRGEILQRRRAEDKMQRLSQIFLQASTPMHIVDLDGQTLQVNEEITRCMKRDISAAPRVNFLSVIE